MSDRYIQLHNPEGDLLYPRTDWRVILNKPSFATLEQLATKQNQLTSANSGPGITIETGEGGLLRISATQVGNYTALTNKPSINNVTLQGSLTLGALGINYNDDTNDGAWEVSDESGNVALRVTNEGHLITKMFNSEDIPTSLGQLLNDVGYITSAYHDSTKLNISDIDTTLHTKRYLQFSSTGSTFSILGNDYLTPIISVDTTSGTLTTSSFNSATVMAQLANALTASTLGTALANGNYNISLFTNNAGYITNSYHDNAKQDVLTSANAGTNVTITTINGVVKINSIGGGGSGGTTDYNALYNKPVIGSTTLVGTLSYSTLKLPYYENTADGDFELADGDDNVILRLQHGHILTQGFDSEELTNQVAVLEQWKNTYHDSTKQDVLTSNNAGTNVTITYDGAYAKINAAGTVVIANPGGQIANTLSSISIGGVLYNISGGSGVAGVTNFGGQTGAISIDTNIFRMSGSLLTLANGVTIPTITPNSGGAGISLTTLQINGVTYSINGVTSFGGATGAITLNSTYFSMSGNQLNFIKTIPTITANPTTAAAAYLSKVNINGTVYAIQEGTSIVPNPGSGTIDLTTITIDGTNYNITDASKVTSLGGYNGVIAIDTTYLGFTVVNGVRTLKVDNLPPVVIANPSGAAQQVMSSIQIGSTVYSISGTGSGVSSLGGAAGAITLSPKFVMSNNTLDIASSAIPTIIPNVGVETTTDPELLTLQIGTTKYWLPSATGGVTSLGGQIGAIGIDSNTLSITNGTLGVINLPPTVIANPGNPTTSLTSIQIGSTKYSLASTPPTATASTNGIGRVAQDSNTPNINVSYSDGVATIKGKYDITVDQGVMTVTVNF